MLEPQINSGNAGFLNQALDLAIALFRRAARDRDDYDDFAIWLDDFALWELGFLVYRGGTNPFNDAGIRKALEHPPNFGGFRLKPSHGPRLSACRTLLIPHASTWPEALRRIAFGSSHGRRSARRWSGFLALGGVDGFDEDEAESKCNSGAVVLGRVLAAERDTRR